MDLVSGTPFWPARSGLLGVYPRLRESVDCDVAILGGGVTGALVAEAVCRAGLEAVVVDRRDIGTGSSAASTGLLQYDLDVPLRRLCRLHGEQAALRIARCCRQAVRTLARRAAATGMPCGFAWRDSLQGASTTRDVPGLQEEFLLRERAGLPVEFWPRRRVRSESSLPWPAAVASAGSAEIDTYRFTHALLQSIPRRKLRVYDRTAVKSWRCRPGGVLLQTADGFRIRARRLVVATGYEAQPFARRPFTALHSTYALVGEPVDTFPGWPGRRLLWETARPYLYLRTTEDKRPVVGGGDIPFSDPATRDRLLPAKSRWLDRRIRALFPRLAFEPAFAWAGTFAETPDGLPYIGSLPEFPRVSFALGYGGNGITFSAIAAEIIRDTCVGETHPDAQWFGFERRAR